MIKQKDPNPLNIFEARQTNILPPHFDVLTQPMMYNLQESITRWIYDNTKGRFYIGRGVVLRDNQIETVLKIGFEDPKESSYFALACPHLKYN